MDLNKLKLRLSDRFFIEKLVRASNVLYILSIFIHPLFPMLSWIAVLLWCIALFLLVRRDVKERRFGLSTVVYLLLFLLVTALLLYTA